jgi:DNA helicase-2/ATP-dependent DNA helicase PcrA
MATGSEAEIEEERRLLYVAMTRAKDDLHIVLPQRFFTHHQQRSGDRHVYAARSRFIPAGMLGLFDSRSWVATRPAKDAASKTSAEAKVDLAADIRAMWQ